MAFLLSSKNVFEYLIDKGLCTQEEQDRGKIEPKSAKNFNLLLELPTGRKLLVKQEPYNSDGKTAGEFLREWRIQEFLQRFPELNYLRSWLPEVVHFDPDNSIIVFNYLDDRRDVADFYGKENVFAPEIACSIGAMLAAVHRATLDRLDYHNFFVPNPESATFNQGWKLMRDLERITPEVFGQVPADGLKFFSLYQRFDSLGGAIADLGNSFEPCCVTHNDLKLNNILMPDDWQQVATTTQQLKLSNSYSELSDPEVELRLIDWERSAWGDPAFDLGSIVTSYLVIWLSSLVVSKSIGIDEALRLAMTPLETIQPSLAGLTSTYFAHFPEILERRPDFLLRVVQFSGLGLIQAIQSILQYQKAFGNRGICMLQVAKTLLCRPEASISTIFGKSASELTHQGGVVVS